MGTSRDVQFIADPIDTLKASNSIDPARILADRLSNGGGMAFLLSCTLPDRIAAVGMVGPALFLPRGGFEDIGRPVPLILFHRTDELFAPGHGGGYGPPSPDKAAAPTETGHEAR